MGIFFGLLFGFRLFAVSFVVVTRDVAVADEEGDDGDDLLRWGVKGARMIRMRMGKQVTNDCESG